MSAPHEEVARLLKVAAASLKSDLRGAIATLESAYALAREAGSPNDAAEVAEELARAWARRKSAAKSLYFASTSTRLAPERKAAWTTLAKTCELLGSRIQGAAKERRARTLYAAAATAFKRAAALTKDAEDRRWLLELASDARRQAGTPTPTTDRTRPTLA